MGGSCAASPRQESSISSTQNDQDPSDGTPEPANTLERSMPPDHGEHELDR
jgi:hypothetical protein